MNNNNPKISIITVCYNSVATIERTILSVIEQTYENIEYIVIDGGSTDGTLDVIKNYSERIDKWVSEPDKGIYDAMNKGIKMATGSWIHFRNSGDFFLFKYSIEQFFKKPVENHVGVIHGNCIYFDESVYYEQQPTSISVSYKEEIPVLHPATFVRTILHKKRLFDLKYKSSADYDFFYNCSKQGIVFEYRPQTIVAFEKGGFSSNWQRAYLEDCAIKGKMKNTKKRIQVYLYLYIRQLKMDIKKRIYKLIPSLKNKREYLTNSKLRPLPFKTDF